jgi:hypothetical protein
MMTRIFSSGDLKSSQWTNWTVYDYAQMNADGSVLAFLEGMYNSLQMIFEVVSSNPSLIKLLIKCYLHRF